jgi:hypothetical protein
MRQVCGITLAFALVVALTAAVAAQSLGDVARKEEARRKAVAGAGKVYTNDQVRGDATPPRAPAPSPGASSTPGASAAPKDKNTGTDKSADKAAEKSEPKKDEAYWRGRMTAARAGVDRAKAFAEALQSQINGLSADFTARDDPRQRALIGEKRQKALDELARLQKEVADLEKGIRDLEEEARRAGVPPGWLR